MIVKAGSVWRSTDDKRFRVISVSEIEGHTWVYYRLEGCNPNINECQEWSCYIESFVQRFTPTAE